MMRTLKVLTVLALLGSVFPACSPPPADSAPEAATPPPPPPPAEVALPPLGQAADAEIQIAGAVAAAPPEARAEATVLGHSEDGSIVTLRRGTNRLICLADQPGDDRFQVACYHEGLEPYMARGRELRAQGVTGPDSINQRHAEIEAGSLVLPSAPAVVYTLGGAPEVFDPQSGEVSGARWVYALYTPYETEESTGLSTTPAAPGAPWIMRPGTPSSHIMVTPPVSED